MNANDLTSIDQVRAFLSGTQRVAFEVAGESSGDTILNSNFPHNHGAAQIVPGTQYLIYGCPELLRRLLNNSGGQHDLDEDTDAGDDDAGKNEQRADKPFDKPGFLVCHTGLQTCHIAFQISL